MKSTKEMTIGTPWKVIIAFAVPILISNIFQQLYNSVDSLIVGNYLGKEALAAVSSSGNLIFLFTSFFIGTAQGAAVVISKHFGEKNYTDMRRAIHTNIAFGLVASIILTILGVLLTPTILRWMNVDESVLPNSIAYFRNYFIGVTGVILYNIFSGILQAVGNSRVPLYFLIFSSLLNVFLDWLFVGVCHFGVGSAATATSISQLASAILCLVFLMRKGTVYQVVIKEIRFHKDMLKAILHFGVPAGVQNSVIALANVVVQSNINSFGADAMAACGTYSKLEGFAFLPITCFTMAITTFIGQNLGAKEYDRAKRGARFGILTSVLLAELIGVILYFSCPFFISLFIQDSSVIHIGVTQFHTIALFYGLLAFSHCIAAVCRGAGKAIIPMLVMLVVWCGIRVLYITIMMHFFSYDNIQNIVYLFWAYPITWLISSIIYFIYYHFSDWIHGFEKKEKIHSL
ncbi:MAG: MATE family efflux transporter [Anaeroplasmataceae bacterium]|nr:MATE family efflux transporter [Anaeroplasmataceae bacterium]